MRNGAPGDAAVPRIAVRRDRRRRIVESVRSVRDEKGDVPAPRLVRSKGLERTR